MLYGIWKLAMQNLKKPLSTSTSLLNPENPDGAIVFGVKVQPMPAAELAEPEVQQRADHSGPHTTPDTAHVPYKLNRRRHRRTLLLFALLFGRTLRGDVLL